MFENLIWSGWDRLTRYIICGSAPPDEDASSSSSEVDVYKPRIDINILPGDDGAIISVISPERPEDSKIADSHVPVDIVLVIDVSGSMNAAAPVPSEASAADGVREDFNLSVLDLTKHAARTILETLNEGDRLAIVTFSHAATILQSLTPMTPRNKISTERRINAMKPLTTTNLWAGIINGLELFDPLEADSNRVPALMVLTDGMPNHGMPPKGYLARLREMAPLPAIVHTFGFGYHIDSCLLRCISEVGSGNYSFIPDAGMIGTVFIHAVAHLQTTYATKCILEVKTPLTVKLSTINRPFINGAISDDDTVETDPLNNILRLDLGKLQYGQSRDIYLECQNTSSHKTTFEKSLPPDKLGITNTGTKTPLLTARLTHSLTRKTSETIAVEMPLLSHSRTSCGSPMANSLIRYHKSRALICEFLGSFMKPHPFSGYMNIPSALEAHQDRLTKFLEVIPAQEQLINTDEDEDVITSQAQEVYYKKLLNSLLLDLEGQVSIALSRQEYFSKWALPYFASLSHAHSRQLCNTFKDPGVQEYNQNDFFRKCRDALDEAFDKIEPPVPSRVMPSSRSHIRQSNPILNMQCNHPGDGSRDGCLLHTFPPGRGPVPATIRDGSGSPPPPAYSLMAREGTAPPAYTPMAYTPTPISMAAYNNRSSLCFSADTMVQLSSNPFGAKPATPPARIPISQLRTRHWVLTPHGGRQVRYTVRCQVENMPMCRIQTTSAAGSQHQNDNSFLVTPYHPILIQDPSLKDTHDGTWIFPANAPSPYKSQDQVFYTGDIYSIMLQPDKSVKAHAILISGAEDYTNPNPNPTTTTDQTLSPPCTRIWGVTLGHGAHTSSNNPKPDARIHEFFGSYSSVERALLDLVDEIPPPSPTLPEKRKRNIDAEDQQDGEVMDTAQEQEQAKRRRVDDPLRGSGVITIGGVVKKQVTVNKLQPEWLVCGFRGPRDV